MILITSGCDAIEKCNEFASGSGLFAQWLAISWANEVMSGPLARSFAPCETISLSKAFPFSSTKLTLLRGLH